MRPIIDTNRLDGAELELGMECEQLLTPLTRYRRVRPDAPFAVDNGAFTRFDGDGFRTLLEREREHRELCRFVTVPDVIAAGRAGQAVGDASLTREVFDARSELFPYLAGWPLAYVVQDGQEAVPIPWRSVRAVFVGGSDGYKDGAHAAAVVKAAKLRGLWVHVGRVNGPGRYQHFADLGADSFDGSGVARTTRQRVAIRDRHSPSPLFAGDALAHAT